jgi:hypothetical protein
MYRTCTALVLRRPRRPHHRHQPAGCSPAGRSSTRPAPVCAAKCTACILYVHLLSTAHVPHLYCTDPGARTTDTSLQDAVLQAAAALGRPLFVLFNHPAARVADGTAVIMRAIAERGAAAAAPMRDAALREGAILHHLQLALFASGEHITQQSQCKELAWYCLHYVLGVSGAWCCEPGAEQGHASICNTRWGAFPPVCRLCVFLPCKYTHPS